MITCPNCKHQELEGALFCSFCGTTLIGIVDESDSSKALSSVIDIEFPDNEGKIQLAGKEKYVLGRSVPTNKDALLDLDLEKFGGYEMGVSRQHAMIKFIDGEFKVIDLNSSNRTFLNEDEIYPGNEYSIGDECMLRLGKLRMKLIVRKV
jgi:pSer/pThr/pTyr-binding forkhead associated (FHA) protein